MAAPSTQCWIESHHSVGRVDHPRQEDYHSTLQTTPECRGRHHVTTGTQLNTRGQLALDVPRSEACAPGHSLSTEGPVAALQTQVRSQSELCPTCDQIEGLSWRLCQLFLSFPFIRSTAPVSSGWVLRLPGLRSLLATAAGKQLRFFLGEPV